MEACLILRGVGGVPVEIGEGDTGGSNATPDPESMDDPLLVWSHASRDRDRYKEKNI